MEYSGLSDYDAAQINATWLNWTDDQFKCKKTEEAYLARKDAEIAIKTHRIRKGCGVLKETPRIEIDRYGYHSCLCHENYQHPLMGTFLTVYQNYKLGNLPFSGSLMEQPSQIMEIIGLMEHLHAEQEIAMHKKHEAEMKKTSPKSPPKRR